LAAAAGAAGPSLLVAAGHGGGEGGGGFLGVAAAPPGAGAATVALWALVGLAVDVGLGEDGVCGLLLVTAEEKQPVEFVD
jgi:hypothetical protein